MKTEKDFCDFVTRPPPPIMKKETPRLDFFKKITRQYIQYIVKICPPPAVDEVSNNGVPIQNITQGGY